MGLLFLLCLLLLLDHVLDDLLFLNQERSDDTGTYAFVATGTSVGTSHVLLVPGNARVLVRAESGNL